MPDAFDGTSAAPAGGPPHRRTFLAAAGALAVVVTGTAADGTGPSRGGGQARPGSARQKQHSLFLPRTGPEQVQGRPGSRDLAGPGPNGS